MMVNQTLKTKDWARRIQLEWDKLVRSKKVTGSCYTSSTRFITNVTGINSSLNHERQMVICDTDIP